jgi:predicted DNA-binding protein
MDRKKLHAFRLDKNTEDRLKIAVEKTGKSESELVRDYISQGLLRYEQARMDIKHKKVGV